MKRIAMLALVVTAASCAEGNAPDGGVADDGGGNSATYSVTGGVTGPGMDKAVLTLQGTGASRTATSSADGGYQFLDVSVGSYTLAVAQKGFAYTPSSQVVRVATRNVRVSNITSITAQNLSAVSGAVSGDVTAGVLLTLSGTGGTDATVLTATGGAFRLDGVVDGSYTLTPSLAGYTFSPATRTVKVAGTAVTSQNFISAEVPNAVSGTITGDAKAGVALTLAGTAGTFTGKSDTSGAFTVAGARAGTYTLTPSLAGYAFFPATRTVTVARTAVSGQDFGGVTVGWKVRSIPGSSNRWYGVVTRSNGKYLAAVASYDNLYTSSDYGATWSVKGSQGEQSWYFVNMSNDGQYLALSLNYSTYMYLSDDYGATLNQKNTGEMATKRRWQNIAMSRDGRLLATVARPGHVYTSSDYGATWQDKSSGEIAGDLQWRSIAMSDDGTRLAAVVNGGFLYMSNNSGTTWQSMSSGNIAGSKGWKAIAMSSNGEVLAAVDGASMYISRNYGATWENKSSGNIAGFIPWSSVAMSSDGKFIAAAANTGSVYVSENFGDTWQNKSSGVAAGDLQWNSVTISDDGRFLAAAAYNNNLYTFASP